MKNPNNKIFGNVSESCRLRHLLFTFFAAIILPFGTVCKSYAQSVFSHYEGYAGLPLVNGMQQVHEYEYYYYVDAGNSVQLMLPFSGFSSTSTANRTDEPAGYVRWFDYTTDMASDYLQKTYSAGSLTAVNDASGKNRGLFFWQSPQSTTAVNLYSAGVTFNAPSTGWTGSTIACDVSKYTDFNARTSYSRIYFQREPTLQMRYIFHIKPRTYMADAIRRAAATDVSGVGRTFEDNKRIVFGAKDENATMAIRLNQNLDNDGMKYCFYPLNNYNSRSVYPVDDSKKIKLSDFGSTMYTANYVRWRVYNEARTKYCNLLTRSTSQFLDISIAGLKKATWYNVGSTTSATTPTDIGYGHVAYVVADANYYRNSGWGSSSADYYCPIANYEVMFQNTHPKSLSQILADGDHQRSVSYLQSHYGDPVVNISFDDTNADQTLDAPTRDNNASKLASRRDLRSYGYVYPDLIDQACPREWPLIHGEYGLYKSANVSGVSDNSLLTSGGYRMYSWNAPNSPQLYDRTHEINSNQYGYFLYVDASEESRQIAAANFEANLCSGSQLIFSAAATDFTSASATEQPQLLFRLYGIDRNNVTGNIKERRLIQSFSSGDFENNVTTRQYGIWHQIFGEMTLQRSDAADNYTEFQIVIDNMCKNTNGADYAVDDIRIYLNSSKVEVLQNKPICEDVKSGAQPSGDITLKLRSVYDNLSGNLNYNGSNVSESKVFFRFSDEENNPVSLDYDGDGNSEEYAVVEVPVEYSATDSRFETVNEKTYFVLANRHFDLPVGKKYYVSVAYPDEDGNPDMWATPQSVCSTYSPMFEIVKQNIIVNDANGNVVTTVRIKCDGSSTPNVDVSARLETVDKLNGGKITLGNVRFDWFFSEDNEANDFSSISGLQEALGHFRHVYPEATTVQRASGVFTSADRTLLLTYVNSGRLVLSASSTLSEFGLYGRFEVAAIPVASTVTVGEQNYDICPDPMMFNLRVLKDGPRLYMGFSDVTYPSDERTLRIGLPQIRAIIAKQGALQLPIMTMEDATRVMLENDAKVWIADSNDPLLQLASGKDQWVATLTSSVITSADKAIGLRFNDDAIDKLREGYWYELNFSFVNSLSSTTVTCPGDVFIKMCVVPEFATWNSSQITLNSSWNNDANWLRSTREEIYKNDYTVYGERDAAFMPMAFTKVTIVDQTGKIYPNLSEISYQINGIANRVGDVAYDMVVSWNSATADHSDSGNGDFSCQKWTGNCCDEIYFKDGAELLFSEYLAYNKAYVEKELMPNKWYILSSPISEVYAGDFYVPSANGRDEAEAFKPVTFDEERHSRSAYPIYQRDWDGDGMQTLDNLTGYKANDAGTVDITNDNQLEINEAYWTHVYNKVDTRYDLGRGFAVKAADKYTEGARSGNALIRLPKADTEYVYYDNDSRTDMKAQIIRSERQYRIISGTSILEQPIMGNEHDSNRFYLVGNPFTSTISAYRFLMANGCFDSKVWTLVGDVMESCSVDLTQTWDKKTDVLIAPMQAFFVKLKDGEQMPENVVFNSQMMVNRWITGGEKTIDVKPSLSLTALGGSLSSKATIAVCQDSHSELVDNDGVELLATAELSGMAQAYSAVDGKALAVNVADNIDWIPVGVVAQTGAEVDVEVEINRQLRRITTDVNEPLYLFDADNGHFTPLANGTIVRLLANDHGRYYITRHNSMTSMVLEPIVKCFSPNSGTIVVAALQGDIQSVKLWDVAGRIVLSQNSQNGKRCTLNNIKSGIYVVNAMTNNGDVATFKIAVR